MARRPLARPTATGSASGRSARWSAARAGLLETDDEPTTRAKVAATVAEHVPDPEERRWIEPALLALLGIERGAVAPTQLFAAWRTFFERLAATAPVVMVFEDFHHADSGLIDFVDHLLEWRRGVPDLRRHAGPPRAARDARRTGAPGKRNFTSIYLEPLPPAAMRELLAGLVPGPAGGGRDRRSSPEPTACRCTRSRRSGCSSPRAGSSLEGGAYRPTGDLTTLAVPETLTALIASRLDGLPPEDRALVSDAAVLGQSFTVAGLVGGERCGRGRARAAAPLRWCAASSSPSRSTRARPSAASTPSSRPSSARSPTTRWRSGTGRSATSRPRGSSRASAPTSWPAGSPATTSPPTRTRRGCRGRRRRRPGADRAHGGVAQRAAALGSHDQAMRFLEQALLVTTDPVDEADLLERAGAAASAAGRHEAAEAYLGRALAVHRELGDRAAIVRATAALARPCSPRRQNDRALALLDPAADEFADLAAARPGIALAGPARAGYFLRDDNRRAIELVDRVLDAAEHADLRDVVADTLVTKGTALGGIGRPIEGLGIIAAGRDLAEADGLTYVLLRAVNNLTFLEALRNPRAALEISRGGSAIARRLGDRSYIASMIQNIGEFSLRTGDWTAALTEIETALTEDWDPVDRSWLLIGVSSLRALRGEDVGDAVAEVEREPWSTVTSRRDRIRRRRGARRPRRVRSGRSAAALAPVRRPDVGDAPCDAGASGSRRAAGPGRWKARGRTSPRSRRHCSTGPLSTPTSRPSGRVSRRSKAGPARRCPDTGKCSPYGATWASLGTRPCAGWTWSCCSAPAIRRFGPLPRPSRATLVGSRLRRSSPVSMKRWPGAG